MVSKSVASSVLSEIWNIQIYGMHLASGETLQTWGLAVIAGQPQDLAKMSQELLWLWSPVLVAVSTTECLKRYLMAQVTLPSCAIETLAFYILPLAIIPSGSESNVGQEVLEQR